MSGAFSMLNARLFVGILVAVLVFIIHVIFVEFLVVANGNMQRQVVDHCKIAGETSLTLRKHKELGDNTASDVLRLSKPSNGTACYASAAITATDTWYTENGTAVTGFTASAANAAVAGVTTEWQNRYEIMNQFGDIIEIIGEIIPLLLVVTVAAEAFILIQLRNDQGGLERVIAQRVLLLVTAYLTIILGETVFQFTNEALGAFLYGIIAGTSRFEGLSKLVLSLVPLAYEILILMLLGWSTYSGGRMVIGRGRSAQGSPAMARSGFGP